MKTNRIIPFSLNPKFMNLRGKERQIEKIKYEYEGYQRELRLIELEYSENKLEKELKLLDLNFRFYKITEHEYELKVLELTEDKDSSSYKKGILDYKKKYKEITQKEYEKELATLERKSWWEIINSGYEDAKDGTKQIKLELDWNKFFVEELRESGYRGRTDDEVVNSWFVDSCRQIADDYDLYGFGE